VTGFFNFEIIERLLGFKSRLVTIPSFYANPNGAFLLLEETYDRN